MDLFYVLLNHHEFPAQQLMYAEHPWTLQSTVIVVAPTNHSFPSLYINNIEYRFFLEITMVKTLFNIYSTQNLCVSNACQRILEFAAREQHSSSN